MFLFEILLNNWEMNEWNTGMEQGVESSLKTFQEEEEEIFQTSPLLDSISILCILSFFGFFFSPSISIV